MCDDGKSETISYSAEPAAGNVIRPYESHQWFALAVKPRFDKAVARALERNEALVKRKRCAVHIYHRPA